MLTRAGQSTGEQIYSARCASVLKQDIVIVSHSHLINEKKWRGFSLLGYPVNHCVLVVFMVACVSKL